MNDQTITQQATPANSDVPEFLSRIGVTEVKAVQSPEDKGEGDQEVVLI